MFTAYIVMCALSERGIKMSNKARKAHNKKMWEEYQKNYADELLYEFGYVIYNQIDYITDTKEENKFYPYKVTHNGITEYANVFAHFATDKFIEEYAIYKTKTVNKRIFGKVMLYITILMCG